MYSIYKPVYLKGKAMAQCNQCPIPTKQPKPPGQPPGGTPPPPPPGTSGEENESTLTTEGEDDDETHIPVLICRGGVMLVWPHEATRDVLTGKIPYYYADEDGCTKFSAKHIFCALKLNRKQRDKYGEYPLVGGHQRFLPKKEKKSYYRRRYMWPNFGIRSLYDVSF